MALHLVTGGSGFVGSHTAQYLLDRGEDVRIFDMIPPDVPDTDLSERAEFICGDVTDRVSIEKGMTDVDYVHHNVALVPLSKAGQKFWEVNVNGTDNVMQAALKADVEGVAHISSSAVYDISRMPVTEHTNLNPIGRYGRSKLEGDRIVQRFVEEGLPANIIRPRTVVDARRAGIYQILFDWVERNNRIFMLGDGTNQFQLVSARDLADVSRLAAAADVYGEVFNVGNLSYNSLGEDLRHLIEYAGSSSNVTWIPAGPGGLILRGLDKLRLSPLAKWHYKTVHRDYYFDISKVRNELGWEPTDSNFDMLERAFDWYSQNDIDAVGSEGSVHRTAPKQRILRVLRDVF